MALYQDIMNVPGLSGTWQKRNADLYKKLGAPFGKYTGSYSQNVWLQNQIKKNNFFKKGLPGAKKATAVTAKGGNAVLDPYLKGVTDNVNVDSQVYSQDVMPLETWRNIFDPWTLNFINDNIRPEWEANTYNPAMKEMSTEMNTTNQQYGNTGSWRSSAARNNLADMGKEAIRRENQLQVDFNNQSQGIRDSFNEALVDPLYKANMERFVTAPWRDMNTNQQVDTALAGMTPEMQKAFQDSLANKGINYGAFGNGIADTIGNLNNWDPTKTATTTQRDWSVKPTQVGMGTNLFSQYTGGY